MLEVIYIDTLGIIAKHLNFKSISSLTECSKQLNFKLAGFLAFGKSLSPQYERIKGFEKDFANWQPNYMFDGYPDYNYKISHIKEVIGHVFTLNTQMLKTGKAPSQFQSFTQVEEILQQGKRKRCCNGDRTDSHKKVKHNDDQGLER